MWPTQQKQFVNKSDLNVNPGTQYLIRSTKPNKCLDMSNSEIGKANLWEINGGDNQKYKFDIDENGWVKIINIGHNSVL